MTQISRHVFLHESSLSHLNMVLKIICTIKESWMSDQIFIYLLPDLNVTSVLLTLLVFRQLLEDNAGYYLHFCTVN